jgi:hypothetical protein
LPIYYGSLEPSDYKFGNNAVSSMFVGDTQVWPASGTPTDRYFAQVSLLLHGETLADSSRFNRTITTTGSPSVSTDAFKYGASSLLTQSGGVIKFDTSVGSFDLFGNFVIEWWQYVTNTTQKRTIFYPATPYAWKQWNSTFTTYPLSIVMNGTASGVLNVGGTGTANTYAMTWTGVSYAANTWQHFALSREGRDNRLYVDGTLLATKTNAYPWQRSTSTINLGDAATDGTAARYIDDFRVSVGTSRGYTGSTITKPSAAYPDAQQTSLPFAVVLTQGTSFPVPSGYSYVKAWAVGPGAIDDSASGDYGSTCGAGGVAYKVWSLSGVTSIPYSIGVVTTGSSSASTAASKTTSVTLNETTIKGYCGFNGYQSDGGGYLSTATGVSDSTQGGANGGGSEDNGNGCGHGALNANGNTSSPNRKAMTDVSGLLAAVQLSGGVYVENQGISDTNLHTSTQYPPAFGSGGATNKYTSYRPEAGYGGGGGGPGAVVLYFY